jgi:hypothetical protein
VVFKAKNGVSELLLSLLPRAERAALQAASVRRTLARVGVRRGRGVAAFADAGSSV